MRMAGHPMRQPYKRHQRAAHAKCVQHDAHHEAGALHPDRRRLRQTAIVY